MRPIVRYSLLCAVMLLVAACQDRPSPVEPGGISALVSDGAHGGGNPDFFFLPPLVGDPSSSPFFDPGKFNGRLLPVMAVFKGTDQCSLSNTSKKVFGPAVVPVVLTLEQYKLEWNTSALRVGTQYRLCIFGSAAGKSLGFLDLSPVSSGLKNIQTGDVAKFQQGRVIPVKFRIERGALSYNPDHPSEVGTEFTVDKTGGSATLVDKTGTKFLAAVSVPANAVPQGQVTIVVATEEPQFAGKCVPTIPNQSNGCYQLRTEPALYHFADLVRVEICVDPEPVPPALRDQLRVFKFNTTEGLQALAAADPTLIGADCSGSGLGLNGRLQERGVNGALLRFANWAGRLVTPREAHAAELLGVTPPKGIGGLTGSFSDFGGAVATCSTLSGIMQTYCSALVDLYNATDGPNWTDRTNWLETDDICIWHGVNCVNGIPYYLLLGNNNVTGTLPVELGNLDSLRMLQLYKNHLNGALPASIGNLHFLQQLDVQQNQLSGAIPVELGTLSQLLFLDLRSNQLSGGIPEALGSLRSLDLLELEDNQLSGTIPAALANLGSLEFLYLRQNQLSGLVPLSVGQLGESLGPGRCDFAGNTGLSLGDSPDFRAADLNGDGFICGLPLVPLAFTSVNAGYEFTCGLTGAGTAYCWGFNQSGQLGNGTTTSRLTPGAVHMPSGKTFATLAVGGAHACGLTSAGDAYCWGENNSYGQVGDGTLTNRPDPVQVQSGGVTFASIIAGGAHTCGLTSAGQAYCWGYNLNGQLGDNSTTNRSTPVPVVQPEGVTFASLTAGGSHTCGLTTAHVAYCWGWDDFGQLGDGNTTDESVPVAVQSGGVTFATLTAGGVHTCGKTPAGVVSCWGSNDHGELGDGTNNNASAPVQVVLPAGVDSLTPTAGGNHACGVTYQGIVYCWGYNLYGQIGDGTNADRLTPVPVVMPAGAAFASLSSTLYHTCALTPSGAAWCWGSNGSGQLGDGTTSNRPIPVAVH